jgi:hypothetical protein
MTTPLFRYSVLMAALLALVVSCGGTKLYRTHVDETFKGQSVSNILVIGIVSKDRNRRQLEQRFVEKFQNLGVKAIASADAIPMPSDLKLEKTTILDTVQKFGNDAVIITHVVGISENETIVRNQNVEDNFYTYYGTRYNSVSAPGYARSTTNVRLETSLYEVKSEHLIWSTVSETWNRDSARQVIDEVVTLVVNDLHKRKLIASP